MKRILNFKVLIAMLLIASVLLLDIYSADASCRRVKPGLGRSYFRTGHHPRSNFHAAPLASHPDATPAHADAFSHPRARSDCR